LLEREIFVEADSAVDSSLTGTEQWQQKQVQTVHNTASCEYPYGYSKLDAYYCTLFCSRVRVNI